MYSNLPIVILSALLGAICGSFTTLLIHRLHYDETGIVSGRSRCPKCKHLLGVINLIPIFSWLIQKGKCAFCKDKISFFYPLMEFVFVVIFILFVQKFYSTIHFVPIMIAVFLILILFFYDVKFMEVDRRISFPTILFALGWAFFREAPYYEFLIGGVAGFLFYFIQYYFSHGKWVGAGDMELGAVMGLLLGWKFLIIAMFFAYIFGLVVALPLLIFKKATGKTPVPMGAFLMPATLFFLYDGKTLFDFYFYLLGIYPFF